MIHEIRFSNDGKELYLTANIVYHSSKIGGVKDGGIEERRSIYNC